MDATPGVVVGDEGAVHADAPSALPRRAKVIAGEVPDAVAAGQVAAAEGPTIVHAIPVGPCAALAGLMPDAVASTEGQDAVATTGAATIAAMVTGVALPFLIPVGLHGITVGLGQARLVMELAPDAVPLSAEGQPGVPAVRQEGSAIGTFATTVGAVPTKVRQAAVRPNVPAEPAVERLVVVMRKA